MLFYAENLSRRRMECFLGGVLLGSQLDIVLGMEGASPRGDGTQWVLISTVSHPPTGLDWLPLGGI